MTYLDGTLSLRDRTWLLNIQDERHALTLSQKFDLSLIMGRLLSHRNIEVDQVEAFLSPSLRKSLPDPALFKDMDVAIERLYQALDQQHKITIFGDYDVDGATSSAVLFRYLQALGGQVNFYIPDRLHEGYGPNIPAMEKLAASGTQLLITVDCGMTAFASLETAQKQGLDVIVVDHHLPGIHLPPALAVINPNRLDEPGTWGSLAAVGVCFLLVVGLNRALRQRGFFKNRSEPEVRNLLDLVALGTVCDVVPLQGLNRVLVAQGLKVLGKRQNQGLKILMDNAGVGEHPTGYHLGFLLGPRINAGGRVGKSLLGTQLLTTDTPAEAQEIAQQLSIYNQERQAIELDVLDQALKQAQCQTTPFIVVAGEGWHPGVIGIVAGRLKERYHRPALVIALDGQGQGKGSGRSIPGIDLGMLIQRAQQKDLLIQGGGHAMAAGFSLSSETIAAFHNFLNDHFSLDYKEINFKMCLRVDGHLTVGGATAELIQDLEKLAPFGQGNAAPRFLFETLKVVRADVVGKDHVRCILASVDGQRLTAIAFRCVDQPLGQALLKSQGEPFHFVGTLKLDTWKGEGKIQLIIEDVMYARPLKRHLPDLHAGL